MYNQKEDYWSFPLGWGNMDENDYIIDSGFMFAFYESGPWLGAKFSKNPAMAWIGGGTKSYEIGVTLSYSDFVLHNLILGLETYLPFFKSKYWDF